MLFLAGVAIAGDVTVHSSHAQARGQAEKPQMAEEVFKNVQMLKGIPVKEFMGTMVFSLPPRA
jgi:hypothetical protein